MGPILAAIAPLSGHSVFLLLVQLALLLMVARFGALIARACGLPAVVGELAAGIVLGPTVFGHYLPTVFATAFPPHVEQFHLLETVGVLGMVLLLLLTGLETDLKLLRNLGRAAVVASVLGMIVPFVSGFGLGMWMPDAYLAQPDHRMLFAAFLATALSISAMPVIAKILMDLDLTRRNIGLVILSAGVVDDTAGWLVLSVIAGAATQGGGIQFGALGLTLVLMGAFLAAVALVAYPLLRALLRVLAHSNSPDTELVVIVVFTLVCAAITEHIGIHAVFGAFIAGTALRQVPHLKHDTVQRLESFVFTILAPVFFGTVGLKVDLWALSGGGETVLGIVVAIACMGKLVGCTVGGLWGGLGWWEAVSIAVAMNARGAMELVVASIGLSLGILNQQMFSMIVVVAISTSFMAPIALRLLMRMVRMTDDEEERLVAEQSRGIFDPTKLRILVPTSGSQNGLFAARIADALTSRTEEPVEIIYVDEKGSWFDRIFRIFGASDARKNIEEHLNKLRDQAGPRAPKIRRITGQDAAGAVVQEAARGFDMILAGASGRHAGLGGHVLEEIVDQAPCHVAIVKAGTNGRKLERVFVPVDGSSVSRAAAEFALHYAEAVGADLTLGLLSERRGGRSSLSGVQSDSISDTSPTRPLPLSRSWPEITIESAEPSVPVQRTPEQLMEELVRISPVFRISPLKPQVIRIDYDPGLGSVANIIARGKYGLVVLGAENRAVRQRLFFGHENERIINLDSVTTIILVPHLRRAH